MKMNVKIVNVKVNDKVNVKMHETAMIYIEHQICYEKKFTIWQKLTNALITPFLFVTLIFTH